MRKVGVLLASCVALAVWPGTTSADPWKDESGHGKWRESYQRGFDDWRGEDDGRDYRRERRRRADHRADYRPRAFCKVKRKAGDDQYKEEWKCRGGARPSTFNHGR
jgi:hypothetical protein